MRRPCRGGSIGSSGPAAACARSAGLSSGTGGLRIVGPCADQSFGAHSARAGRFGSADRSARQPRRRREELPRARSLLPGAGGASPSATDTTRALGRETRTVPPCMLGQNGLERTLATYRPSLFVSEHVTKGARSGCVRSSHSAGIAATRRRALRCSSRGAPGARSQAGC
jgi:hypothetical protein